MSKFNSIQTTLGLYPLLSVVNAICAGVDAERDVTNHAVLDILAISSNDTDDGVVTTVLAAGEDAIGSVGGAVDLGVLGVGLEGHDLLRQGLVEVDLAGRGNVAGADGAVLVQRPVRVGLDVDVDGALDVEAREDGLHLHDTLAISGPLAAQPGGVVGVEIRGANLKVGNVELGQELGESSVGGEASEARVTAGGVAVPKVEQDVGNRLASGGVNHTDIQPQRDTRLVLGHILPQRLGTGPDIGSLGHDGAEDARVVLDAVVVGSLGGDLEGGVARSSPSLGHAILIALLVEVGSRGLASARNGTTALDLASRQVLGVSQG